jgi:aryl-alcohol dehydrogenase-like predicted oxidoreductase
MQQYYVHFFIDAYNAFHFIMSNQFIIQERGKRFMKEQGKGVSTSTIILGTWAIGGNHWGPSDDAGAIRAIETAINNGIHTIDTAPVYGDGHAEELVGKAIQGKREKVFLASKCGLDIYTNKYQRNLSSPYIEHDLTQSLRRLKTEYIDLYQCHWPDPQTPIEETMAALLRFQEQGKIRFIGVSNFSRTELEAAMKCTPLFSLQSHYSLLERTVEADVLPWCRENGVKFLSYGSLGAGVLTGKYTECKRFPSGDARSFFYRFFKPRYWPRVCQLVDAVREMASSMGTKPGVIALAWLLRQPGVTSVIVGARSPEQVMDNIIRSGIELSNDAMHLLNQLSQKIYEKESHRFQ